MWDVTWIVLAAVALLAYGMLRARERFVIKYGNPFKGEELLSFDRNAKGKRLIGFYPDTCPAHAPDLDVGLCYKPCAPGYVGRGPICWAETKYIGLGVLAALKSCEESGYPENEGWIDLPFSCFKQPSAKTGKGADFYKVWEWKWSGGLELKKPKCPPGAKQVQDITIAQRIAKSSAGPTQARAIDQQKVYSPDVYSDPVGTLCYRPCPPDKPNHVPGAPYLCFKNSIGKGVSYERGAGTIPPPFILGEG